MIFICHTNEFCGAFEIIHPERRNLGSRVSVDVSFFLGSARVDILFLTICSCQKVTCLFVIFSPYIIDTE